MDGEAGGSYAYGLWPVVAFNIAIFLFFAVSYQGWMLIHGAKEGELVTGGIYARVRHPQYDGIFLITVGFLIKWPGITTLVMWPVLTVAYYRLARREERQLEAAFGAKYREYRQRVPAFIPRPGKGARP